MLDLDDVGAHLRHQEGGGRPRDCVGEVEHPVAAQKLFRAHGKILRPFSASSALPSRSAQPMRTRLLPAAREEVKRAISWRIAPAFSSAAAFTWIGPGNSARQC